tara:strand:- start:74 stop:376 length:303 start_codon:yes stop_codon:yes gene_type:complete
MPTVQIRSRIDRDLKRKSDDLLKHLGMDTSTYLSLSLAQLVNRRGLPFAVTESDEAYFHSEYGLSSTEARKTGQRLKRETTQARRNGELHETTGPGNLAP